MRWTLPWQDNKKKENCNKYPLYEICQACYDTDIRQQVRYRKYRNVCFSVLKVWYHNQFSGSFFSHAAWQRRQRLF